MGLREARPLIHLGAIRRALFSEIVMIAAPLVLALAAGSVEVGAVISACAVLLGIYVVWRYVKRAADDKFGSQ